WWAGRRARDHRGIAESTDPATRQSPPNGHSSGHAPTENDAPWPYGRDPWNRHDANDANDRHDGWGRRDRRDHWSRREGRFGHGRRPHHHLRHMRRSSDNRILAGICGGISQTTGIDVTFLRIGAAIVGLFAGFPVLIYALAWLIVPLNTE